MNPEWKGPRPTPGPRPPMPMQPRPGEWTVDVDYAAYVDSVKVITAVARIIRLCNETPDLVDAPAVLDLLRGAGVSW